MNELFQIYNPFPFDFVAFQTEHPVVDICGNMMIAML